jgi:hypothetical protein
LRIEGARYEGGELILKTSSPDARRFVYQFKGGEYELKKSTQKRSLDANAYCWVLCSKIAAAVGISKEEVYQRAIQEGDQYLMCCVTNEDFGQFVKSWQAKGLGWRVQVLDDSGLGSKTVFAYYGSSVYDSRAMNRLIDSLQQEAKSLGIETMPEDEVRALLEAWA